MRLDLVSDSIQSSCNLRLPKIVLMMVKGTEFGDNVAKEVLESARWASCGWPMTWGRDGPQGETGRGMQLCLASNRWGTHPVVTAIHTYDLDWEKFFLKHGGDIPLGAPTPKLIQVLRNGTDR